MKPSQPAGLPNADEITLIRAVQTHAKNAGVMTVAALWNVKKNLKALSTMESHARMLGRSQHREAYLARAALCELIRRRKERKR